VLLEVHPKNPLMFQVGVEGERANVIDFNLGRGDS
jgi:hypothetical protein